MNTVILFLSLAIVIYVLWVFKIIGVFAYFKGALFWKSKEVALGTGSVTQFILFEHKKLFSIIFYRWNTIDQVRFHTHAFAAVAFLLKGWYWEEVIFNKITMQNFVNVPFIPRFLPRNYCPAIKNSKPGTLTLVITGPWQKNWFEYFPDTQKWVKYAWGRVKVGTYNSPDGPQKISSDLLQDYIQSGKYVLYNERIRCNTPQGRCACGRYHSGRETVERINRRYNIDFVYVD